MKSRLLRLDREREVVGEVDRGIDLALDQRRGIIGIGNYVDLALVDTVELQHRLDRGVERREARAERAHRVASNGLGPQSRLWRRRVHRLFHDHDQCVVRSDRARVQSVVRNRSTFFGLARA